MSRSLTLFEASKRFGWPSAEDLKICELTVTYACNARCLFCYNPSSQAAVPEDMDMARVGRILLESRQKNDCWAAFFTGGDVTVHPDLPKFIALARKIGYSCISVDTNGIRLSDPKYARRLVDAGANVFGMSIHGHTAEIHDRLVGVPGAWNRAIAALDNLIGLGVHIKLNVVLNRLNYRGLPQLAEMMTRRFGVTHVCIAFPHYRGIMEKNHRLLGVTYSEIVRPTLDVLAQFARDGVRVENQMLISYLPCIMPGYEDLMQEWNSSWGTEDYLFLPEGPRGGVCDMMKGYKTQTAACATCVYSRQCMGPDREYLEIYGSTEFTPLTEVPHPVIVREKPGSRWPDSLT